MLPQFLFSSNVILFLRQQKDESKTNKMIIDRERLLCKGEQKWKLSISDRTLFYSSDVGTTEKSSIIKTQFFSNRFIKVHLTYKELCILNVYSLRSLDMHAPMMPTPYPR